MLKISKIKNNPDNPRVIKDERFKGLVQSIKDFPEMLELRPIVIDEDNMVLGGNQRLKACKELKLKEVPVKIAKGLTEQQKKEFIIKDNASFGEWDWGLLKDEWNEDKLYDWGLELEIETQLEKAKEGEVIKLDKSLQVIPKSEYIIITEPEDSVEWEELKNIFKCKRVRSGGCEVGSSSDNAMQGLERVFNLKTFKERVGI